MSSDTPNAVRGTQDIFGPEAEAFAFVVETFERVRRLYRFRRAELPVFERTEVFARSLGETTDVVSKEMYSFEDRGGSSLTLRPEFTAGIARAYLTNGWQQHAPLKLATHGACFRYERPQKGRYRQFHQLDAEIIGAAEPQADVELLAFADQLLRELGVADGVTLTLNTLGDAASREAWRAALIEHFAAVRGELSEDSQKRLEANPLRILDSKDRRDKRHVAGAPKIDEFLTSEAGDFFEAVTSGLDAAGVAWQRDSGLVRGFDYYRHTAFEFVTDRLGAQGTVLGGGRYDGLMEFLGGPETPAVGWAAGIERLAMLVGERGEEARSIIFISDGPEMVVHTQKLIAHFRKRWSEFVRKHPDRAHRVSDVSMAFKTNQRKQFEKEKKAGAAVIVTVRPAEEENEDAIDVEFYVSDDDLKRQAVSVGAMVTSMLGDLNAEPPLRARGRSSIKKNALDRPSPRT